MCVHKLRVPPKFRTYFNSSFIFNWGSNYTNKDKLSALKWVQKNESCGYKSRTSLNIRNFFNMSFLQPHQQSALKNGMSPKNERYRYKSRKLLKLRTFFNSSFLEVHPQSAPKKGLQIHSNEHKEWKVQLHIKTLAKLNSFNSNLHFLWGPNYAHNVLPNREYQCTKMIARE